MNTTTANAGTRGDSQSPWIERWHQVATHELTRHVALDGLCRTCGRPWPCVTCQRAEFALGSC